MMIAVEPDDYRVSRQLAFSRSTEGGVTCPAGALGPVTLNSKEASVLRLAMILCLVAASSEPLQLQTDSPAAKNLAEIRKQIAGREQEPAENVFKNIELLKGRPAARLPDMMRALTGLLGVECTFCHVEGRWESEENVRKVTARKHFAMQAALNREQFGGANKITCWTCHRGSPNPEVTPR